MSLQGLGIRLEKGIDFDGAVTVTRLTAIRAALSRSAASEVLLTSAFFTRSMAQVLSQAPENSPGIAQVGCVKTFDELIIH
jgi:hypothetical protein